MTKREKATVNRLISCYQEEFDFAEKQLKSSTDWNKQLNLLLKKAQCAAAIECLNYFKLSAENDDSQSLHTS